MDFEYTFVLYHNLRIRCLQNLRVHVPILIHSHRLVQYNYQLAIYQKVLIQALLIRLDVVEHYNVESFP
ncbi:protein of unknown function [Ruminococcaceae bacterium BL-4]|nr:protein of unknown function [Ruminococcaceae bacterium BL-4]